jgi:hypothetical protein
MAETLWACVIKPFNRDIQVLAVSEGRLVVAAEPDVELQEFFGGMFQHAVPVSAKTELPTVRPHQLLERRDVEAAKD